MQLRDYRIDKGLTLHDVASLVGWGFNKVSRHERGLKTPDANEVEKYRKATGDLVQHKDWVELARRVERDKRKAADLRAASTLQAKESEVA